MRINQDTIGRGAILSRDGVYRYLLTRTWDRALKPLLYIMLNPSTADAVVDDPTIRVCMSRARLVGYGGIRVLNLFALRSKSPEALHRHADPIGPDNDMVIRTELSARPHVVCAWGAWGRIKDRDRQVMQRCRDAECQTWAIKLNHDGTPTHPLRRSISSPLIQYRG